MFPGVDEDLKGFLFQGAPQEHCAWVGDIFSLTENAQELVPVRFGLQDFLVGFTSPQHEAANDPELLLTYLAGYADGFVPDPCSRLVKFARVESDQTNHYQPDVRLGGGIPLGRAAGVPAVFFLGGECLP